MNGELFTYQTKKFFSNLEPIFLHFWQIFQNGTHFFENGSTTIFNFLFSYFWFYYTILFIAIEFIFTVILKHIICLPKKPQWLFYSWLDYKFLLNKLSVLNYSVLGGLPIIFLHPAVSHVFHVQVQGLGPGFRSSPLITVPLLYEYISWLHVHFHPGVKLNDDT